MWARIEDNQIKEIVIGNKGIDINGIQYPSSIFSLWSKEELFNIGLVPYSISKSGDNRIKTEGGVVNEISADKKSVVGVTQYTDKPLDDVILYDSDGKEMLNDDGTTAVTEGLKTSYKRIVDERCYNILSQTDWYIVKHTELSSVVPETILSHRQAVREKANTLETKINACSSINDLVKLLDPTVDSDGKVTADPEMTTWPELPKTSKSNNTQIMLKVMPHLQEVPVTVTATVTAVVTAVVTATVTTVVTVEPSTTTTESE